MAHGQCLVFLKGSPATYSAMVVCDVTDGDVASHRHVGDARWWQAVLEAAPVLLINRQLKRGCSTVRLNSRLALEHNLKLLFINESSSEGELLTAFSDHSSIMITEKCSVNLKSSKMIQAFKNSGQVIKTYL